MFQGGPENNSHDKYYDEFVLIYNTYYDDLYRFGVRLSMNTDMTKDCIQEVFIDLWNKREKITDISNIKAYLLKHLSRVVYAAIKKDEKKKNINKLFELQNEIIFNYENRLLDNQEESLKKAKLLNAVQSLSKRKQQIIKLRFLEGYDYEEIASITSLKYNTVYDLSHKAIKALREKLVHVAFLGLAYLHYFS
ncbi:sigma-70 family RNA polymerase sigma factor [Fulvivirgaceae bacterium BMA10]|uniref:Sigma-70 family RNA polymerase sigma factor n=1 Tax=Splendidivirga corallicola TaxID=3051826 RepID=A0ABT8KXJ7_9BACT|nr:sigma-70 family RNA polymerase sigma factor [Fulvivirgaceae bacterium BMA10]